MTAVSRVFSKPEATDRWAIPYADFITLLFALFVVLYGSARIDAASHTQPASNIRLLAPGVQPDGLLVPVPRIALVTSRTDRRDPAPEDSVHREPERDEGPQKTETSEVRPALAPSLSLSLAAAATHDRVATADPSAQVVEEQRRQGGLEPNPYLAGPRIDPLLLLERRIQRALPGPLDHGLVELTRTGFGIKIHIQESLLFNVASARLEEGAADLLRTIAASLVSLPYQIRVEGHTDDRPIRTARYPSNWELSSARASRVVRVLMESGLVPERLAALGFGEHRPIASNASRTGRRLNRRVSIVVLRAPGDETY